MLLALLQNLKPGRVLELDNLNGGRDDEDSMRVERRTDGFYGENGKFDWTAETAERADAKLTRWGYTVVAREG